MYRQARGTLSVSLDLYYKLDRKRFEEVFLWAARSMAEVVVESAHPKQKAKPTPKEWELLEWILRCWKWPGCFPRAQSRRSLVLPRDGLGESPSVTSTLTW